MASVHILRAISSPAPSPLPLSLFFVPASNVGSLPPPLRHSAFPPRIRQSWRIGNAPCIKICTGTFGTFGTFLQKVKNARDFGTACLHFDTSNRTQSYQKDRKCQKCQKCHVIFFFVPCVRIISGHPHFAFLLHICNSVHFLLPNANRY